MGCVWVGWGVAQDSCAVFLEAGLGLRQRQKTGKNCSTRASFLSLLGTLSRFQGAGVQATDSDHRNLPSLMSGGAAETLNGLADFKRG